MSDLKPIIKDSFIQYSGAVLQSRALVDVRDCLKPSARQIFYCLNTDKFVHSKPFKKTLKAIGSATRMYIHGDSSCEGVIMRAGQPFAMRYPLIEVDGSYGNLMESGNWSASRYTSSRLSELSDTFFEDIDKDTIAEWKDNYDDTEQYPMVLPSKGYYNICNGTFGIGIGLGSSCPQFNLKDVNNALIHLLENPSCDFEEIYCAPDFATGGILLNESEVKDSLKNGTGPACKLRAVVEYDTGEKALVVKEIPYGVYTNTICGELEVILESEENPGIERFNDLTGATPNIKIYLSKKANPDKVLKYLFKNTSLQSHFGVNMTMLENGRFPKVFNWKSALQAHIDHEKTVYRKGYEFDLRKIEARVHIINGILICLAQIDEVIETIKSSTSTKDANLNLQQKFLLDEVQAKAVLDFKLSRLAKLEVKKLEDELKELEAEQNRIKNILENETLFNNELIKGWKKVIEKFGDARRTKILDIEKDNDEPIEVFSLLVNLTNNNNIFVSKTSSLYSQKRGGVGKKFKLDKDEYVVSTIQAENTDLLLFFSQVGNFYHYEAGAIPLEEKIPVESLFPIREYERICLSTAYNQKEAKKNIIFFTKNGIMKKSLLSDYNVKRAGGMRAIEMDSKDEICSILLLDEEPVGILTKAGNHLICSTKDLRPVGRIAKGVKSIKLNEGDTVVSAKVVSSTTKEIISVSMKGYIKRTKYSEFEIGSRYTKGKKIQKLKDESDCMVDFLPISNETEVMVTSSKASLRAKVNEIPEVSRGAIGALSIKMKEDETIVNLSKT